MLNIRWAARALGVTLAVLSPAVWSEDALPDPAHGLWLAAQEDGVVEFQPCAEEPSALCGTVVWDKGAKPDDLGDCGLRVVKLRRKDKDVWRDGWVHDPRERKNYKGALRMKGPVLVLRAYIGTELLGLTEEMTRVQAVPAGCPAGAPTRTP